MIKIIKLILAFLFLPFWWLQRLIPRDKNIFVFGSWNGEKYSDNSKALFEYILMNENEIKPYWITKNKSIYLKLKEEKKPVELAYSLKGWLISLRAFFAFNDHSNDLNFYALNGAKRICLWHGMPLKKIEYDTKYGLKFQGKDGKIFSKIKYKLIKTFAPYLINKKEPSITISSSDFFNKYLSTAFLITPNNIWLTGLPRTDCLYKEKTEKITSELREKYNDVRIVIHMPTFRFSLYGGEVYNPFNEKSFNNKVFTDFLENENIVFLYKPHYYDKKFNYSINTDRFILIDDNSYNDLYILISNIDILITDYSSVYFDFLCLNKPAILTPFDIEFYIKEAREHYFDYNLLPSIKAYNWDELMNIITEKKYYTISKDDADKFCKYNDGHASERCLKKILQLIEEKK